MFFIGLDPSSGRDGGLGEIVPIQFSIDTPYQQVGSHPVYTIQNATPGAQVYFSSFKDGIQTSEFNVAYPNAVVEANGSARITGEAWGPSDTGVWEKQILVQNADGSNQQRAMVRFQVAGAAPAPGGGTPAVSGNFFSDPLFHLGSFEVTGGMALIGGLVAFLVFKKR